MPTWTTPDDVREHGENFRMVTLDGPHGVRAVGTLADDLRWHLEVSTDEFTPGDLLDVARWLAWVAQHCSE